VLIKHSEAPSARVVVPVGRRTMVRKGVENTCVLARHIWLQDMATVGASVARSRSQEKGRGHERSFVLQLELW